MGAIGITLKRFRKESKMTQEVLGKKLGLSDATISKIENGHRRMTMDDLDPFLEALGVSFDQFLRRYRLVRRELLQASGVEPERPSVDEIREALDKLQRYLDSDDPEN